MMTPDVSDVNTNKTTPPDLVALVRAWQEAYQAMRTAERDGRGWTNADACAFRRTRDALLAWTPPQDAMPESLKFIAATVHRLDLCGLGRGVTVSSVQRFYRLNYSGAVKLLEVRAACFDALDELSALSAKGGAQ